MTGSRRRPCRGASGRAERPHTGRAAKGSRALHSAPVWTRRGIRSTACTSTSRILPTAPCSCSPWVCLRAWCVSSPRRANKLERRLAAHRLGTPVSAPRETNPLPADRTELHGRRRLGKELPRIVEDRVVAAPELRRVAHERIVTAPDLARITHERVVPAPDLTWIVEDGVGPAGNLTESARRPTFAPEQVVGSAEAAF